ncbi:MAG: 16S rRNA (guanine(966)-N(2))-methyltransferase RsmD [Tepidisphaeraceae bacterium]
MRIIAGEHRGRKLLAPEGDQTRPVTDRVKQSIFDIVAYRLEDSHVYDCFAGTGSFGLESLSRGAAHATFFEAHKPTAKRLLQNLQTIRAEDRGTIVSTDIFAYLASSRPTKKADVVFLDPPYRFLRERSAELVTLAKDLATHHMKPEGVIAFRHDAADQLDLGLPVADVREYGSMTVEFLTPNASV